MIFPTQTNAPLQLDTGIDLTNATVKKILYRKPSGTEGEWTASAIVDNTIMEYAFSEGDVLEDGLWEVQAFFIIAGKRHFGDPFRFVVGRPTKIQP